jgi:hypothetical protein
MRRKTKKKPKFSQLGTYASRAQRDMDNARKNYTAKKNEDVDEEEDDLDEDVLENSSQNDDVEDRFSVFFI